MADNSITLNDIASMATIIDVCTQRGAFKAGELETVGKLFNKLKAFVDEQNKKSEEAKPTADEVKSAEEEAKSAEEETKPTADEVKSSLDDMITNNQTQF